MYYVNVVTHTFVCRNVPCCRFMCLPFRKLCSANTGKKRLHEGKIWYKFWSWSSFKTTDLKIFKHILMFELHEILHKTFHVLFIKGCSTKKDELMPFVLLYLFWDWEARNIKLYSRHSLKSRILKGTCYPWNRYLKIVSFLHYNTLLLELRRAKFFLRIVIIYPQKCVYIQNLCFH